ncbi:hypothetical protein CLAFUW4_12039 [Fulvia fulva]|uniref:Hemerythrin-like domain-containing protein n=1 Tax=Passalora fulva TaxID=5499 RepID=A0A9Q8PFA1_PASFU|nr:uncharacterized protein CLAFUR5_11078 [Fulvia fulva]KAK4617791.1 hypothetical protein CLAFUR4_12044 [Fulvia fulva]KAK4618832.1 hypothetical protein CLAFUR0_12055 [Fulvia fulva]UJO21352.1 hypothetical protein CLAFUR5_11078 [Fulvia fulva]WPV18042.1 hypothetical protein CLAFUW4_12039 [Fulvia fulva]WPV32917.1 hypothetical protein CLAFUW7_12046 [Fulvia fulva]
MAEIQNTVDEFKKIKEEDVPKVERPTEVAMPKEELPKLSAKEFRVYNHMAEHMDMFHENFRRTWNTMYKACTTNKRPSGMSIRQFLSLGDQFCHHLTIHHTIEEQHIFPVLARKMTCFQENQAMLTDHKGIHEGVNQLEGYIADVKSGEKELDLRELKRVMDGFGETLP